MEQLDVCVLARIEETDTYPFGMHINETGHVVTTNVINNNNIITRNLVVRNVDFYNQHSYFSHLAVVANPGPTAQYFTLQMINDKAIHPHFAGDYTELLSGEIILDPTLYARWGNEGYQGNYAYKSAPGHVGFYGMAPMELKRILIYPGERFVTKIVLFSDAYPDFPDAQFNINLRQVRESDNMIFGNITYQTNTFSMSPQARPMTGKTPLEPGNLYRVFPIRHRKKCPWNTMGMTTK